MARAFVYIVTNKHNTTLYVGMTTDLDVRTRKHREKFYPRSFSARYNINKLVYYEVFDSIAAASKREKQLKAGSRKKKVALVNQHNPRWNDLFDTISQDNEDASPLLETNL